MQHALNLQPSYQLFSILHDGIALNLKTAPAEDPLKLPLTPSPVASLSDHLIASDQFDPKWATDKWEIWSYYTYYIWNNGLTLFNFAPTVYQNLLSLAAGDAGTLGFARSQGATNSIVLLSNGTSFAIQIEVFSFLGSLLVSGSYMPGSC